MRVLPVISVFLYWLLCYMLYVYIWAFTYNTYDIICIYIQVYQPSVFFFLWIYVKVCWWAEVKDKKVSHIISPPINGISYHRLHLNQRTFDIFQLYKERQSPFLPGLCTLFILILHKTCITCYALPQDTIPLSSYLCFLFTIVQSDGYSRLLRFKLLTFVISVLVLFSIGILNNTRGENF